MFDSAMFQKKDASESTWSLFDVGMVIIGIGIVAGLVLWALGGFKM